MLQSFKREILWKYSFQEGFAGEIPTSKSSCSFATWKRRGRLRLGTWRDIASAPGAELLGSQVLLDEADDAYSGRINGKEICSVKYVKLSRHF
jgi:hypothetical protein